MKEYNLDLCQSKKLIFIKVSKPITLDLAVSFTTSFVSLGKKYKLTRMVVDMRNTISISSILDKYLFAYKNAELTGLSRSWKIALLKKVDDSSPDFIETVMNNSGYQLKIFTNEECAIEWLALNNTL